MPEIPSSFYVIIGSLVVANIGTVISVFYGVGKMVWFIAQLDARVKNLETEIPKDINAAFEKLRFLEQKIN